MKVIICLALVFVVSECRSLFTDHTDAEFQDECLTVSNNYRAKHHADPLIIDPKAISYAKSRCGSDETEDLNVYGENLFKSWNTLNELNSCKAAIDSWYNEEKLYDYDKPNHSSATEYFTQLVWKGTTGLGCARCSGQNGTMYETYVVCEYTPKGNIINPGYFEQNVQRP